MRKNRFSSLLCLLLTMSLIVFTTSGCGGPKATTQSTSIATTQSIITQTGTTQTSQQATTTAAVQQTSGQTAGQTSLPAKKDLVLIEAITRYLEVKQIAYEAMANKMKSDPSQMMNMMGLIGVAAMDMSLLPITYLAGLQSIENIPGWAGNLSIMKGTGKVDKNGSKYAFQATGLDPQNPFEFKGEYDELTDSMQYVMSENGREKISFEFVRSGEGYASQYFSFPESADDHPENNLIKLYTVGKDIYVGYLTAATKPQSIYSTKPATRKEFIKDCSDKYVFENDAVTVETAP